MSETKINQGVWNNLDELAQKNLIKGIIVVVSGVSKLMGNSGL